MNSLEWVAIAYVSFSIVTFITYGIDKRRAVRGMRRIPEKTLHLLELFGGWPGAILAQSAFSHKRRKFNFMAVFVGIVALHLAAWCLVYLKTRSGLPK